MKMFYFTSSLLIFGGFMLSLAFADIGDGGSRCPHASCTSAPPGMDCDPPSYERDDGCCPVWRCNNGQTAYYGIQRSRGSSSSSSSANQISILNGVNPFSGVMGNLFGNGMFGR